MDMVTVPLLLYCIDLIYKTQTTRKSMAVFLIESETGQG